MIPLSAADDILLKHTSRIPLLGTDRILHYPIAYDGSRTLSLSI
jgi:hypothetical protein